MVMNGGWFMIAVPTLHTFKSNALGFTLQNYALGLLVA